MKQIIISGATGFIGSAFAQYMVEQNYSVISLGRRKFSEINKCRQDRLAGSIYLQINMNEIENLPKALAEKNLEIRDDCVFFNLAWAGEQGLSDLNVGAQMSNVRDSIRAMEVAEELGCARFIQMGTMEEAFTFKYFNLDHNFENKYNRHVIYSTAKIAAKKGLLLKSKRLSIDFTYVLHSHVMGADDDKDSFLQVTLLKMNRDEKIVMSSGEQLFDVISLDDCVRGFYLICSRGKPSSEYWVGSGNPQPLRSYVERMGKLLPGAWSLEFGSLPYNDIVLTEDDFSIHRLTTDTGYIPHDSFEDAVTKLHDWFFKDKGDLH